MGPKWIIEQLGAKFTRRSEGNKRAAELVDTRRVLDAIVECQKGESPSKEALDALAEAYGDLDAIWTKDWEYAEAMRGHRDHVNNTLRTARQVLGANGRLKN